MPPPPKAQPKVEAMMALLDTSHDLAVCAAELGGRFEVGQLLTPLTGYRWRGGVWAGDNGAYSQFDPASYQRWLKRQWPHREHCKFIACPDVVGSARRTLEVFRWWYPKLSGWPIALVAQDGLEDLEIPWRLISAVFIGGTTDWKLSREAEAVVKAAKAVGHWVHVGRLNTPDRLEKFDAMGADSFDGTGVSRYSHMRRKLARSGQGGLFHGGGVNEPSEDGCGDDSGANGAEPVAVEEGGAGGPRGRSGGEPAAA